MLKAYRFPLPTSIFAIATVSIISQVVWCQPSHAEQGKTIQLNGQPWTGQWLKRDSSIYLQDDWMQGTLGVELLDSDRPQEQRLRWFSSPFSAPVTYDQPVQRRFLDIKDISQEWKTEIVGQILRISTPSALISAIRRSKQNSGDRLVIDLDRATPWQVQRDKNVISLAIAAELTPTISKALSKTAGNLIKTISVETQSKQTIIKIETTKPLTPEFQTLNTPNRLVVDIQPTYVPPDLTIAWAKGLTRKQQTVTLFKSGQSLRFSVNSLIVNLKEPTISMKPIWSNPEGMVGTSSLRAIAEVWQAAGAINGGFFSRDRKMPVGAIREGKRWMAGGVLNRGAVAWNPEGSVFMDRLSFGEEIVTNQGNFTLTHLNSGFLQTGLARYTPNWGAVYTPISSNEVIIVVKGDRITSQFPAGAVSEARISIPEDGFLLVARKIPEILAKLPVGTQIQGITNVKPESFADFPNILGAGPLLVKNGITVLDAAIERFLPPFDTRGAARSAIATTKESGQILLTTIQATPEGILPTLSQTADILKRMGAVNALNLDGGGSTTLYLGGAILNRAVGNVAPVHNGLGIFIQPQN